MNEMELANKFVNCWDNNPNISNVLKVSKNFIGKNKLDYKDFLIICTGHFKTKAEIELQTNVKLSRKYKLCSWISKICSKRDGNPKIIIDQYILSIYDILKGDKNGTDKDIQQHIPKIL